MKRRYKTSPCLSSNEKWTLDKVAAAVEQGNRVYPGIAADVLSLVDRLVTQLETARGEVREEKKRPGRRRSEDDTGSSEVAGWHGPDLGGLGGGGDDHH